MTRFDQVHKMNFEGKIPDETRRDRSQVWTISDKDYNELARVSTEQDIFITSDEHFVSVDTPSSYYQFECVRDNKKAQFIEVGNHVIFRDDEGYIQDMTIRKVSFDTTKTRITVYCENGGMDLNNENAAAFTAPAQAKSLEWYLNQDGQPLNDTPIKITLNEFADRTRTLSNDSDSTTLLQRLLTTSNAFSDKPAEYRLYAELANDGKTLPVTQLNLEIKKELGSDVSNTFLVDDFNLRQLTKDDDIMELATAIQAKGSEVDGEVIDLADVVWSEGVYFTRAGDPNIYNSSAREQWSYLRNLPSDDTRGYIIKYWNYDTTSTSELLSRAVTELQKYDHVKTAYSATGRIMRANLGDTIMIATHKTPQPIYLRSRVVQKKVSYVDYNRTEFILGEYQVQVSNLSQRLQELANTIQASTSNYTWIRYADDVNGTGISAFPQGKKFIGLAYNKLTANPSMNPSDYQWTQFVGNDGSDGRDGIAGKDGVGIANTVITYAGSTSGTTSPSSGWTSAVPTVAAGNFLWTKTIWYYTDNTNETGYSVAKMGSNGTDGQNGINGSGQLLFNPNWENYATGNLTSMGWFRNAGGTVLLPESDQPNFNIMRIATASPSASSAIFSRNIPVVPGNFVSITGQVRTATAGAANFFLANRMYGASELDTLTAQGTAGHVYPRTNGTVSYGGAITGESLQSTVSLSVAPAVTANVWSAFELRFQVPKAAAFLKVNPYHAVSGNNSAYHDFRNLAVTTYKEGEKGDPGIIYQDAEPTDKFTGMMWQATGQPLKRWNGVTWVIHKFMADNIFASNLTVNNGKFEKLEGTEIIGSMIQNNFEKYNLGPDTVTGNTKMEGALVSSQYNFNNTGGTGKWNIGPGGLQVTRVQSNNDTRMMQLLSDSLLFYKRIGGVVSQSALSYDEVAIRPWITPTYSAGWGVYNDQISNPVYTLGVRILYIGKQKAVQLKGVCKFNGTIPANAWQTVATFPTSLLVQGLDNKSTFACEAFQRFYIVSGTDTIKNCLWTVQVGATTCNILCKTTSAVTNPAEIHAAGTAIARDY